MYCICWLLLLITLLIPRASLAESAPSSGQKQEAAEHFERGVQLFKEQAYRAAVVEFQRAYDLSPDYRLLYNLGRAKQQLQDYLGASRDYEAYLTRGGANVPGERRTQVEETLTTLSGRVGRVNVVVSPSGADVFLDDVKVGTSPLRGLVMTNVGRHRVSARAPSGAIAAEIIDVAGGDIAEVRITLSDADGAVASAGASALPATERTRSLPQKLGLASLVAGGTSLAASVATGILSLRAKDDLDAKIATLGVDQSAVAEQREKVDRLSLSTDALIGVGAALVVTGALVWLISADRGERDPEQNPKSRAGLDLSVGIQSVALTGRF